MGRFKKLAENTLIFGICSFTSKLLVFLMLPFYTSVLSTEEFGAADLIMTIVSLLLPVLTIGVSQGCMRYAMDKSQNVKDVFSIGVRVIVVGFIILILGLPFLFKVNFIRQNFLVFIILYIVTVLQNFFSLFVRGLGKVKIVGISGVVSSFVVVGSNILLLFVFHRGVSGYLWSIAISHIVAIIILFFKGQLYLCWTNNYNRSLSKEILLYSIPTVPNTLGWWINHSANRLILKSFCSVSDVGLYAAASKMPSIIDTFRGIFVQAWQLSTISEYDKDDSSAFFKNMYKIYNVFIILMCTFLLLFSKVIAKILYSSDFFNAWLYTPLLIVGVLFGSLVTYYSPLYLAHKKTNRLFISTLVGAIITIVLNILLVPRLRIMGTSITTAISYFVIYLYLHIDSRKYINYKVNSIVYYISYIIISIQAIVISFISQNPFYWISILCSCCIILINLKDIKYLLKGINKILRNKIILKHK